MLLHILYISLYVTPCMKIYPMLKIELLA